MFKLNLYKRIEEFLSVPDEVYCFVLGPRRCGKTTAFKQLKEDHPDYIYWSFRDHTSDENRQFILGMFTERNCVYLLDELTYLSNADMYLSQLANEITPNTHGIKIIITGSQMLTLRTWQSRVFSTSVRLIHCTFISYSEWLLYRSAMRSEESYLDYIMHSKEFHHIESNKVYLRSCLDETVIANINSANIILGTDVNELPKLDDLLNILYITLIKLHNSPTYSSLRKESFSQDSLSSAAKCDINVPDIYKRLTRIPFNELRAGILFLMHCGLVIPTCKTTQYSDGFNLYDELSDPKTFIKDSNTLFACANFTISHPMFYYNLLSDLAGEDVVLSSPTIGSIVECDLRRILCKPYESLMEYRDEQDRKIDIVDYIHHYTVECSISNKRHRKLACTVLPQFQNYNNYVTSKDKYCKDGNIIYIPYYIAIDEWGWRILNN